jgi:hypothetical protein
MAQSPLGPVRPWINPIKSGMVRAVAGGARDVGYERSCIRGGAGPVGNLHTDHQLRDRVAAIHPHLSLVRIDHDVATNEGQNLLAQHREQIGLARRGERFRDRSERCYSACKIWAPIDTPGQLGRLVSTQGYRWRSLARIMHHAGRFCTSGRRSRADDPSVWIGVRQLAVQRVWD